MNLSSIDREVLVYKEFGDIKHKSYYNTLADFMEEIESGNVSLMESLASIYEYGDAEYGIPCDAKKRAYWFMRAAQNGSAMGAYFYGNYLVSNSQEGELYDVAQEGVDYMIKSANAGYARAQYMVGIAYKNGFIVEKSINKACHYLQLAAINGEEDALGLLKEMRF